MKVRFGRHVVKAHIMLVVCGTCLFEHIARERVHVQQAKNYIKFTATESLDQRQ